MRAVTDTGSQLNAFQAGGDSPPLRMRMSDWRLQPKKKRVRRKLTKQEREVAFSRIDGA
jgi:hypothetical protein